MLDKLMKLKETKQVSLRPVEKNAKMSVLKDLMGEAASEMGGSLKSFKKPELAPKKEQLQNIDPGIKPGSGDEPSMDSGDEKADIVMEKPAHLLGYDEGEVSAECSPEEMDMEPDALDRKISALMKLKKDKLASKGE